MSEKITIKNNKMNHILAVARFMYQKAIDDGKTEDYARQMFLLGYLHDIGYEFCEKTPDHPNIGAEILKISGYNFSNEILYHGKPNKKDIVDQYAMDLLDEADLLIDHKGRYVGIKIRLDGIKERYGEDSHQYKNALATAKNLNLI